MSDSIVPPVLSTESEFDKVSLIKRSRPPPNNEDLVKIYNLDRLVDRIIHENYQNVALQFPDDLIQDSTYISRFLSSEFLKDTTDRNVYILADTSYSPCCVDEVAAKHVNADVIVHFGNACLNPVRSFPVIYIFDSSFTVDINRIESQFAESIHPDEHILLIAETNYSIILNDLYSRIKDKHPNCVPTSIYSLTEGHSTPVYFIPPLNLPQSHTESTFLPTRRHEPLKTDLSNYKVFFITSSSPSSSFVLHLSTLVSSINLLDVTTYKLSIPKTALQKRYKYMNVARTASTIGILINTLSLRNVNEVLFKVKSWITQAGKKHYTFVVGKPNVPKLANFDVVDIWVVLGCSMGGIIVNCDDFYKPIITPYELNLALQSEISWTGQWLIDFENILSMTVNEEEEEDINSDEDDAPVFDPISGKYVSTSRPLRRRAHIDIEHDQSNISTSTNALATRMSSQLAIRGTVSTAAEYLHNKTTWKGLGSDFNDNDDLEGADIKEGRGGIARGYKVGDRNRT